MQKSFYLKSLSVAYMLTLSFGAVACPSGQYSWMGMCMPEIGGDVGRGFEQLKKEIPAQMGGVPLEQWIIASHNSAVAGALPIPPGIRQALTGYASEDSMNRVRYKIGDNGFLNLARMIEQGGYADAVTLIDVVIFRGPSEAANPAIWAHELTHVDQYRDWGVHSFAIQYARDFNSVEAPAYAKGNGYAAWEQQNIRQQGGQWPAPPNTIQATAQFCVVGPAVFQRCALPMLVPRMSNCTCTDQIGRVFYGMAQ
ncbi:DUF4157 domain-containing protein [Methylocystis sp. JAN1]|uniref:eCIS core domain-containing protein n=1 Tax=Methylocystis sp. JAN1 TaxID=3397211 RepID=UPI003FA2355E